MNDVDNFLCFFLIFKDDEMKKRKRKTDAQLAALAAGRNRAGPRAPVAGFTAEANTFALEIDGNRRHSHEPNRFQADDFPLQRQRSPPARKVRSC